MRWPSTITPWAAINGSRRPKVLIVTPGNPALELAVSTPRAGELADVSKAPPSILQTKQYQTAAAAGEYELDHLRSLPAERDAPRQYAVHRSQRRHRQARKANRSPVDPDSGGARDFALSRLVVRPQPTIRNRTEKWWSLGERVDSPQIIDVDRTHPLTEWLDLGDVDFAQARPVTPPPGGTRLIDSNKGTLFAIASREGFEDAVLSCEIYSTGAGGASEPNTNWPIRRSFPEFVYAVLSYLGGGGVQAGESLKPGQPMTIRSEAAAHRSAEAYRLAR